MPGMLQSDKAISLIDFGTIKKYNSTSQYDGSKKRKEKNLIKDQIEENWGDF
ncbi:hypothetical protein BY996DRAFT_6592641 [Phakopsora pachyrhizi]|nr:hypothetical protein BY996DRAFT_6592641 [Phakopsora pachyrhizi]